MRPLTLAEIRATLDTPRTVPVDVPELGGTVHVRVLKLVEVTRIQSLFHTHKDQPLKVYPPLVVMAACDEAGVPLFDPKEGPALVENLPWPAVDRIARAALKANRMGDGDDDPKGES